MPGRARTTSPPAPTPPHAPTPHPKGKTESQIHCGSGWWEREPHAPNDGGCCPEPWRAKITVSLSTVPTAPAGQKASPTQAKCNDVWLIQKTITAHRMRDPGSQEQMGSAFLGAENGNECVLRCERWSPKLMQLLAE